MHWLTPRLGEFIDLYPDIRITLITTDEELDLAMREADVAIRLRQPTQPDLIQRKLFSVRFHAYASPEYLKRFGTPRALDDLDNHRLLLLGGTVVPNHFENRRWLVEIARNGKGPRTPTLTINNVLGVMRACQRGIGVALLPDYLVEENGGLVQLFGEVRFHRARRLLRVPRRIEVGRASPGVSRFPGRQGAALAQLSTAPRASSEVRWSPILRDPHGWHATLRIVSTAWLCILPALATDGCPPPRLQSPSRQLFPSGR